MIRQIKIALLASGICLDDIYRLTLDEARELLEALNERNGGGEDKPQKKSLQDAIRNGEI